MVIKHFLMKLLLQGTNGMEVVLAVFLLSLQMLLEWSSTVF